MVTLRMDFPRPFWHSRPNYTATTRPYTQLHADPEFVAELADQASDRYGFDRHERQRLMRFLRVRLFRAAAVAPLVHPQQSPARDNSGPPARASCALKTP